MEKFILPLKRYAEFQGRSRRSEYWYFFLFIVIVQAILSVLGGGGGGIFGTLSTVFGLAMLVPSIAVGVRRLHDVNKSGWWMLWWILPVIGWIIVIIQLAKEGDAGPNQYGPDPKAGETAAAAAA